MGELFPSFSRAKDTSKDLDKPCKGSLFKTIEYELSSIIDKINRIDTLCAQEIQDIIIRQHSMILNYNLFLSNDDTRKYIQILFTNKKFLINFLNVIRILDLSDHEKIYINKVAYDYYINNDKQEDEISKLLYQLTTEVNSRYVIVLSGIIGMHNAQILSMIRNSSFNEEKTIHRVNTYLIKCGTELSVQNIISILCFLYNRFGNVFIFTMLEAKPDNLTKEQNIKFDNISLALLEIVNSLSTQDIIKLLYDYAFTVNMVKNNTPFRFSLNTIVGYPRIQQIISQLRVSDNLFIP